MWTKIRPVYGAGIQTYDLQNTKVVIGSNYNH